MTHHFFEHYALLGLKPGAQWRDLKRAYRVLVKKWHPDRFPADTDERRHAEEQTKAINRAYDELTAFYHQHAALPLSAPEVSSENSFATPPAPPDDVVAPPPAGWRRVLARPRLWAVLAAVVSGAWLFIHVFVPVERSVTTSAPAAATPAPGGAAALPSLPAGAKPFFTYGSTPQEVYAAQGIPSHTQPGVWHYGTSKIHFRHGVVVRWEEHPDYPLQARLGPDSPPAAPPALFARGSTKADVRRIQGDPIRESDRMWDYGVSRVYFEGDRVVDWYESPLDPLKVER